MNSERRNPRFQTPSELAGAHIDVLMRSKDAAVKLLSASDLNLQLAAILICESTWKCGANAALIDACRKIITSSAADSYRISAIGVLGRALSSSKELDVSVSLANVILDCENSDDVRLDAYWALREVQLGISDPHFFRRMFYSVKSVLQDKSREELEKVKSDLLIQGQIHESLWNSTNVIDWDFVHQFVAHH